MDLWQVFIYGLVQGISEFLPISSSGHLALLPLIFKVEDPGVFFDLMMHVGTAFSVLIYFRLEIIKILKETIGLIKEPFDHSKHHFAFNFHFATLVSVLFIFLLKDTAFEFGRNPLFIGFNLIFFGALMWVSDLFQTIEAAMSSKRDYWRSFLIGMSQSFAIFPGVSRSGITMTFGRFSKLSRLEASRFSFLLSLPIIFASTLYKLKDVYQGEEVLVFDMELALIGISVSFVVGILSIHFFLKLIQSFGLWVYALYRFIIGALVLLLLY